MPGHFMAVDPYPARLPRELPTAKPAAIGLVHPGLRPSPGPPLRVASAARTALADSPRLMRFLEMIPGGLALLLISILIWGYIWIPDQLAVGLILFDVYWLWKSWTIGYHVIKG